MDSFDAQTVVIGAGVVGLACAVALAKTKRDVLVLERNYGIGQEVSARNSEVIHAGIYYPPGSLKAALCVTGRKKLVRYCADHGIAHQLLGKMIVASTSEEMTTLQNLMAVGLKNGVNDLVMLSEREAKSMEPALNCVGALYSPSTGIVDSHGLMLSLQAELEEDDGVISFGSRVESMKTENGGVCIDVVSGEEPATHSRVNAKEVINCAGLEAVALAHSTEGASKEFLPEAFFSKGNYFKLMGKSPFTMLIYPAPVPGGLGTHLVLDLEGNARFGPDVETAENANADLEVDASRVSGFYDSIRRYWSQVDDHKLIADYAGLRPKTSLQGSHSNDFQVLDASTHGVSGMIHCLGIESPGLTASLAIADQVVNLLEKS